MNIAKNQHNFRWKFEKKKKINFRFLPLCIAAHAGHVDMNLADRPPTTSAEESCPGVAIGGADVTPLSLLCLDCTGAAGMIFQNNT